MSSESSVSQSDGEGVASFKWKTLALWAVIIALVSLTALSIVATIANADALAVVALALAVMAFVVQIIVFIVQGIASSKQAADTAALNAQTLRALATIEEKSEGTRLALGTINDRFLDFVFDKAKAEVESVDASGPSQVSETNVFERAKEIIRSSQEGQVVDLARNGISPKAPVSPVLVPRETPKFRPFMTGPMSREDAERAQQLLEPIGKDTLALVTLGRLGVDLSRAELVGRPSLAGMRALNRAQELYAAGLVKRVDPNQTGKPVFVLTEIGKLAAKALVVSPPPLNEEIVKMRRIVEDFNLQLEKNNLKRSREYEDIEVSS